MQHPAVATPRETTVLYQRLLASCATHQPPQNAALEQTLAQITAAWISGHTALPATMGLSEHDYLTLLQRHFPTFTPPTTIPQQPLEATRLEELEELTVLLQEGRSGNHPSEIILARIIAAASLGVQHLWQDLGLEDRTQLTALLHHNFAPLAKRNDRNMKWKRFFYKQLCDNAGVYSCRVPSCELCSDTHLCFAGDPR
ncbi:MAG: nitrogen fixation protein NifQ [Gammaproteobacteria bacterium]|nr:nitrogen fixation protein NifQ [Gammaproteobacteria bacterium]